MNFEEELIIATASKVHEDWCMQELHGFWNRAVNNMKNGSLKLADALNQACFKGDKKRNELFLDVPCILGHESIANNCLNDFNDFMILVKMGAFDIKRFTKRNLTLDEQKNAGENYKKDTGEENILRPFINLSAESKKENLEAAIGAYNVFVQMSKAGITIEQMEKNPEIANMIGIAIHTDWLKRNMNHPNEDLKVPYANLDEWTQNQDLTVFNALLSVVKLNPEKYFIPREEGFKLPDYEVEESELLGINKRGISK